MRLRQTRISVTDHALERYWERVGPTTRRALANEVRRRLLPALRLGVYPDRHCAVRLEIRPGFAVVVAPSFQGGWELLTVYWEWEEAAG